MTHPLDLAARTIDSGEVTEATNRITNELSELADGIALVESFSHSVAVTTDDGLVVFDASGHLTGASVVAALRAWSVAPVHTLVYTHGHLDHVGGSPAFAADAEERGHRPARCIGHENVPIRMDRYVLTDGYNRIINNRQFGGVKDRSWGLGDRTDRFLPVDTVRPDLTYRDRLVVTAGDTRVELRHARGETDDHTWAWLPDRRTICAGDFLIWNYPNAGNPQKVQRYPGEWAAALREMAGMGAELFVPAHGLPIGGTDRIATVLLAVADSLEHLVRETLAMMNDGATLDDIVNTVRPTPEELALPYLRPLYDEPEFVVRNIWRQYGGWWDGDPAELKPAPKAAFAAEVAALAGGAMTLADRASTLSAAGEHRLACHLVELAARAEPDDPEIHATRAQVYWSRRRAELSLMAKGIYAAAARESEAVAGPADDT